MGDKATDEAKGTVGLWEPGVLNELRRKVTPALYCELLGRELSHNVSGCSYYQSMVFRSKTVRAINHGRWSSGQHRKDRKQELPHHCVLCLHSKSLKDRRRD